MRAPLVPCPSCARHVRASADSCPFCHGEIAEAVRAAARAPARRTVGLGRAAVFGVALSTAAAGVGCGDSEPAAEDTVQPAPEPTTGGDTPEPVTDPGTTTTTDDGTVDDDGSTAAEYGAPAPE